MSAKTFLENKKYENKIKKFMVLLSENYDLKKISLSENDNEITLNNIIVDNKKQGTGTKVLQEIIKYANMANKTILLDPEVNRCEKTSSKARLIKFYKKFGFVENKGKNIEYDINHDMYKIPESKPKPKRKY